jgi:glycosyltransferase involved in cell wall biosynthesis
MSTIKKPSILLINRVYPPQRGATARIMQDLAYALHHTGWQVTVLTTGQKKAKTIEHNITIHRLKETKNHRKILGFSMLWMRLCRKALSLPAHDVVVTLTDPPMTGVIGGWVAKIKKSKHVHWSHDLYPDLLAPLDIHLPKFLQNYFMRVSRRVMNQSDKVVVIGDCMAKHLSETGVEVAKIKKIANWADFEVITPSASKRYDFSKFEKTGVAKKPDEMFRDDSPKFRVLYAGNIGRAHPVRPVVEAAALLADHKEIEFVFVGNATVQSILARERGLRGLDNIKFMPYQPIEKLREVMESGDVQLVSQRDETLGLLVPCKFYSGLTVGRPTIFIGPENTEIGAVIKRYKAGKRVPTNDPEALSKAILTYREDGEAWFEAQEGALHAAQAYHPNLSLHKWIELLEKLCTNS